ncbi:hypothetical protein GDO86_014051 [Hymenochirus boettgeri]|uniref:CDP-diacylglycerol--glycerol-3-phosphate 3-phosphatidyltransferase n=1 Tax=Hymenochirus boettgeri TaxID=247094 RepID=A0A8T2JSI4_9PIPI|nr:hypothetical protein GDO86_014051 [Hymenochirus boettgeri]
MKEHMRTSRKRITMASLYLGTGPLEQELVNTLEETLQCPGSSNLQISILLDYTRGSRGQ